MKKTILQNLVTVFCFCILCGQLSAQSIPDPGNDPLADSSHNGKPVTTSDKLFVTEIAFNKYSGHQILPTSESPFLTTRYAEPVKRKIVKNPLKLNKEERR